MDITYHYTVDGKIEPIMTSDEYIESQDKQSLDSVTLDALAELSDDDILQLFLTQA